MQNPWGRLKEARINDNISAVDVGKQWWVYEHGGSGGKKYTYTHAGAYTSGKIGNISSLKVQFPGAVRLTSQY